MVLGVVVGLALVAAPERGEAGAGADEAGASRLRPVIVHEPARREPLTRREKGLAVGVGLGATVLASGVILFPIGLSECVLGCDYVGPLVAGTVLTIVGVVSVATIGRVLARERRPKRRKGGTTRVLVRAGGLAIRF